MSDFFDKLRVRRSVLKRTTRRKDLPEAVLYLEWLGGESARRVLDAKGEQRILTDQVLQSNFRVVSGGEAKKLIAAHWTKDVAEPRPPVRKADS